MIDKIFSFLSVVRRFGVANNRNVLWVCRCSCGTHRVVSGVDLRRGKVISCGCKNKTSKKHGESHTSLYRLWADMKKRCYGINRKEYKYYGGRGITVSDEWASSFLIFKEDMGDRPFDGATLDRIDNLGPYSKDNCRWATMKTQCRNRRDNRIIMLNGEERCLSEWAEIFGITVSTLNGRLLSGKTMEEIAVNVEYVS